MKIFINAGHNLKDPGVVCNCGLSHGTEAELNMLVRDRIREMVDGGSLTEHKFFYVPDNLNLKDSIEWVNEWAGPGDFGVETHFNSNSNKNFRGTEAYYAESDKYAKVFSREIAGAMKIPNRGAKHDSQSYVGSLGWLRKLKCPSVLVECAYVSNPEDMMAINADNIASGIISAIYQLFPEKNKDDEKKIAELKGIIANLIKRIIEELAKRISILKSRAGSVFGSTNSMENYSSTQSAHIVVFIGIVGMILRHFRIVVPEGELTAFVVGAIALGGLIWSWIERWKKGDLTLGGFRRN